MYNIWLQNNSHMILQLDVSSSKTSKILLLPLLKQSINHPQEKQEAEEESKEGDKDDTWAKLGDTISQFFKPDEEVRIGA